MTRHPPAPEPLGDCPICGRPMVAGPIVDRHHFLPRAEGGRESAPAHRICHRKLHTLWTERELAQLYQTPEAIREHPEVRRFVAWLRRKPPEFWAPTRPRRGARR